MLNTQDWEARFKENLPFSEKEILICGLPETEISRKLKRQQRLTPTEERQRKVESTEDIFLFAGFVEPGKH